MTITLYALAQVLGCDPRALRPTVAVVNHLPFITALDVDGADGLAMLRDVLDDRAALDRPLAVAGTTGHEAVSRFTRARTTVGVQYDSP